MDSLANDKRVTLFDDDLTARSRPKTKQRLCFLIGTQGWYFKVASRVTCVLGLYIFLVSILAHQSPFLQTLYS